jgi:hypothetical protein
LRELTAPAVPKGVPTVPPPVLLLPSPSPCEEPEMTVLKVAGSVPVLDSEL